MRSATASTPSMSSDSPVTGPRPSVAAACTPTLTVTRPASSKFTVATGSMRKWIAVPLHASIRPLQMSDWLTTPRYDKCCTTTSLGRPRQRCPATTGPPTMCRTASPSHAGHGMDSMCKTSPLRGNLHVFPSTYVYDLATYRDLRNKHLHQRHFSLREPSASQPRQSLSNAGVVDYSS